MSFDKGIIYPSLQDHVNWFLTRVSRIFSGGKNSHINKWCWDKWISKHKGRKLETYLTPHKNEFNINHRVNIIAKNIKLLKENRGINLYNLKVTQWCHRNTTKKTQKKKQITLFSWNKKLFCCYTHTHTHTHTHHLKIVKMTHRIGENICKPCIWQEICI